MNWNQAKIIMNSGLPVRRSGWQDRIAAGLDRSQTPPVVVYYRGADRWQPTTEDEEATDWTLAVG